MTPPAPAAATTYAYDALGDLTTVTVSGTPNRVTQYTYDLNGNKTSETDPNGNTTTYVYDGLNRVKTVTYPAMPQTTTTYTYDFRNNIVNTTTGTTSTQPGHTTHNVYDPSGRLNSVTEAYDVPTDATTTSYTYYNDGRKATVKDPRGNVTNYAYDASGRLTTVAYPIVPPDTTATTTSYTYDDAGNQTVVTDGRGKKTQSAYDSRKRLLQTTYDDQTTTVYAYDGPGNLIQVTDQAKNQVQYTYDLNNQLRTVVQLNPTPSAASYATSYNYDTSGNLISLQDANTHTTQNGFDIFNELNQEMMPAGQTQTRTYDSAGNLATLTDYNGNITKYTYDSLNRLLSRAPQPSATTPAPTDTPESFTYTPTGKRATMTDASGTTTYSYDDHDRLISKATPQGTLTYTYDAAGNVASMQSSNTNGVSVAYTYDNLNRLSTVVDNRLPGGQNTTTYAYDPASNLATVTYPNGLQSQFTYDDLNRVTALNNAKASYTYTLDGTVGNRKQVTESSGRTVNWSYDGIYRLTQETISLDPHSNNGSVAYGLDPVGNRLSQQSTLSAIASIPSLGYDPDDRVSTERYDNNGNTLVSGASTFVYDFENRLKSMTAGSVSVTLQYDGDGNRVGKTVGSTTSRYLVDDLNPTGYAQVVEELVGGAVTRQYTYGLQRINQNQLISSTWTPSFYGYDGFGSVRTLTDSTGTVTDTYDYDAWGNTTNTVGSTTNAYLYRGEQLDPDLGLYYLRARYFNPVTGRFLTRDPYEPCGCSTCGCSCGRDPSALHKYMYGAANPVNRIDPSGRDTAVETALLAGAVSLPLAAGLVRYEQQSHALANLSVAVGDLTVAAAVAVGRTTDEVRKYVKCLQRLLLDNKACNEAYQGDFTGWYRCIKAAEARFFYCTGRIPGPVQ
jgi:RHS repeat-associated protein